MDTLHIPESFRTRCLSAGMHDKMIPLFWKNTLRERADDYAEGYMDWCHEKGFLASNAVGLGITEENYREFISDFDYYRLFPLNNWMRMWVNDKLSLKYMLHGTSWQDIMPKYYYYSTPHGLRRLIDAPESEQTAEGVLNILRKFGKLACKPNNGSCSVGFRKLEYLSDTDSYSVNSEPISKNALVDFINNSPNLVYTEYLSPCRELALIHPKIHTIRVIVINEQGNSPEIVGGYVRFPVNKLGEANYIAAKEIGDFTYYTELDLCHGKMYAPSAVYRNKVEPCPTHPDTGHTLQEGTPIPRWEEIRKAALGIAEHLFGLEYIGYDFCMTDDGVKLMEINTHPGNMGCQYSHRVFSHSMLVEYLRKRLQEKDNLLK